MAGDADSGDSAEVKCAFDDADLQDVERQPKQRTFKPKELEVLVQQKVRDNFKDATHVQLEQTFHNGLNLLETLRRDTRLWLNKQLTMGMKYYKY